MIRIITGPVDSGKTSRMLELYRQAAPGTAGGFVSRKIIRDGSLAGYEICRLADGAARLLAVLDEDGLTGEPAAAEGSFRFSRFLFLAEGFRFGESIIRELLRQPAIPELYLDEIGPIELSGRGFAGLLDSLDPAQLNLCLCIRSDCLEAAVKRFKLEPYEII